MQKKAKGGGGEVGQRKVARNGVQARFQARFQARTRREIHEDHVF